MESSNKDSDHSVIKKFVSSAQNIYKSLRDEIMDSKYQIDRLLGQIWKNPYEILLLKFPCTEEDIKRHYKLFSIAVHPDRCDDPRANDAFTGKLISCFPGIHNIAGCREAANLPAYHERGI